MLNSRAKVFKLTTIFELGEANTWLASEPGLNVECIEIEHDYMIVYYNKPNEDDERIGD